MQMNIGRLHRIVYCSEFFQPALGDLEDALPQILAKSQKRNADVGVTGMLLTCNGWFLQVLEGPMTKVLETLGRIKADPRHHGIQVLSAGSAEERKFPEWSMCGIHLSRLDAEIVRALEGNGVFNPSKLSAERADALLVSIATMQRKRRAA